MATERHPHSRRRTVFLDDGGVMNNNELRGPQWQRLIGEFMPSRLGGEQHLWSEANRIVFEKVFDEYGPLWQKEPVSVFYDDYLFDWLGTMCQHLGIVVPVRQEVLSIAREASAYITRRVHSAFPGAIDAIRALHAKGFALHTASAEQSDELAGYLEAMGVRELFGKLYGPDLLDLLVHGPEYYEALFEDSSTEPAQAIVVDDSEDRVSWATDAGAVAFLVSHEGRARKSGVQKISSLAELPSLIDLGLMH